MSILIEPKSKQNQPCCELPKPVFSILHYGHDPLVRTWAEPGTVFICDHDAVWRVAYRIGNIKFSRWYKAGRIESWWLRRKYLPPSALDTM